MKILYKCEHCNEETDCLPWMEEHEKLCRKNPANSNCWHCIRHIYLQVERVNICTKYGSNHDMRYGEKCKFYIKNIDTSR